MKQILLKLLLAIAVAGAVIKTGVAGGQNAAAISLFTQNNSFTVKF